MVEGQDVGTAGQLDSDRVLDAVGVVVFGELYAQSSSLDANHRIELGIEVSRAAEDFRRNLILLDGSARVIEGVLGEISKKLAQLLGAMQGMTVHQLIDLPEILISLDQLAPPATSV